MTLIVADLSPSISLLAAQDRDAAPKSAPEGASLAEKIACAWLLVGGTIMLYYGPKERENGQLTMDGKSEAVAGAVSIGISIALLHDILTKRRGRHTAPPGGVPASSSRTAR